MAHIIEQRGSIFDSGAQAYVNPVNCRGALGKGLALEFKNRFPKATSHYVSQCNGPVLGPVKVGFVLISESGVEQPRWILHFPTKDDWRLPSTTGIIEAGLFDLFEKLRVGPVQSIAIPALGCGLGGLSWDTVRHMITGVLERLSNDFVIELYRPKT